MRFYSRTGLSIPNRNSFACPVGGGNGSSDCLSFRLAICLSVDTGLIRDPDPSHVRRATYADNEATTDPVDGWRDSRAYVRCVKRQRPTSQRTRHPSIHLVFQFEGLYVGAVTASLNWVYINEYGLVHINCTSTENLPYLQRCTPTKKRSIICCVA